MPSIIKRKDAKLTIIGDGPQKQELLDGVRKLRLESKVFLLGYVKHENLPDYYNDSDIFILPSLFEGMSNTILEAMACGLPIITTDTGGTKELIKGNGIIIKKGNPQSIVHAVFEIKKDMGKISRKIALDYSWENVAEKYYRLYVS